MTSEGMGEMFEGDFVDMCTGVDGGLIGGSRLRRPGSEEPHWRAGEIWSFSALGLAIVVGNDDVGLPLYVDILFGNHSYNL